MTKCLNQDQKLTQINEKIEDQERINPFNAENNEKKLTFFGTPMKLLPLAPSITQNLGI